jgi:hypothetical protein
MVTKFDKLSNLSIGSCAVKGDGAGKGSVAEHFPGALRGGPLSRLAASPAREGDPPALERPACGHPGAGAVTFRGGSHDGFSVSSGAGRDNG